MSGIILAIERPIKIGDIVKVDDVEGEVKDIGLRASQIQTWNGSDVLVPNDSLISGKLTNRTFDNRKKRLETDVQVGVDVDIRNVINLIMDAVKTVPDLMEDPGPYVNYVGIIEGRSVLRVYGWINDVSLWREVGIDLKIAVFEAIRKEGIEISAPVIDVTYNQKLIKN